MGREVTLLSRMPAKLSTSFNLKGGVVVLGQTIGHLRFKTFHTFVVIGLGKFSFELPEVHLREIPC